MAVDGLDGGGSVVFYNRGLAFERQGRSEEAATAYSEAVRLDPRDVEAQVHLGLVLRDLGRDEEANQAFSSALDLQRSAGAAAGDSESGSH